MFAIIETTSRVVVRMMRDPTKALRFVRAWNNGNAKRGNPERYFATIAIGPMKRGFKLPSVGDQTRISVKFTPEQLAYLASRV